MDVTRFASRMQVCTFSKSCWSANSKNKPESQRVNEAHGTGNKATVRVRICDHPALGKISKRLGEAYAEHVQLTKPSIQDGMRLLPIGKAFEHAEMVRMARQDIEPLIAEFVADYPEALARAPIELNGLFDPKAWPPAERIRDRFGLTVHYLPCPTGGEWDSWLEESHQVAVDDLRDQLEKAIRRVQERCASDGKLYDTVFTNLREILDAVPDLDLAPESEICRLAELAQPIALYDADQLRENNYVRQRVASQAADVFSTFGTGSLADV